jgi:hypothetical protein
MATTQLEKVQIVELTKYGFKDGTGAYIGWSKNLDEKAKIPVVPGRTFNMELYIADSGKKYVNKVLNAVETADVPKHPDNTTKRTYAKKGTETVATGVVHDLPKPPTFAEAQTAALAKDRRISRQGVIQAAVQAISNLGMCPSTEDLFPLAEELANQMLEFVNK